MVIGVRRVSESFLVIPSPTCLLPGDGSVLMAGEGIRACQSDPLPHYKSDGGCGGVPHPYYHAALMLSCVHAIYQSLCRLVLYSQPGRPPSHRPLSTSVCHHHPRARRLTKPCLQTLDSWQDAVAATSLYLTSSSAPGPLSVVLMEVPPAPPRVLESIVASLVTHARSLYISIPVPQV